MHIDSVLQLLGIVSIQRRTLGSDACPLLNQLVFEG